MTRRIRRHINPLNARTLLTREHWIERYQQHGGPIYLDLGCAKGEFLATVASRNPKAFCIGIELRSKIGDRYFEAYQAIPNLCLLIGNANLSVRTMFAENKLQNIYINFPDPYSKKRRHEKRRMITRDLVNDLHDLILPSGTVHTQTDDAAVFEYMHRLLSERFACITNAENPSLTTNETGSSTEWETACRCKEMPIYRARYKLAK